MPRSRGSGIACVSVAVLLAVGACATAPPAASPTLEQPVPAARALPVRLWLHPVEILDTSTEQADRIAEAFTLSFHQYLTASRRFEEVRLPPARPEPGDLAAQLLITRYRAERTEHEMAWWGWWRIAGGPVYRDHAEFAGKLIIVDADGDVRAEASDHRRSEQEVSSYDSAELFPSAAAERTRFIETLLDEAARQLATADGGA